MAFIFEPQSARRTLRKPENFAIFALLAVFIVGCNQNKFLSDSLLEQAKGRGVP